MTTNKPLTDATIEAALARCAERISGDGLQDQIMAGVAQTSQSRPPLAVRLGLRAGPAAPAGLPGAIGARPAGMPDERRPLSHHIMPPVTLSPVLRFAWIIALTGLLLAGAVSSVLVGGELLRRVTERTLIPPTTVLPVPSAPPVAVDGPVAIAAGPVGEVNDLAFADDGSLWLATGAGIVHWDVAAGSATLYNQRDGLLTPGAVGVDVAPDESIWAGGNHEWLARFDGGWTAFSRNGDLPGLDAGGVLGGFTVGADGTLWVAATDNAGAKLIRFDGTWTVIDVPQSMGFDGTYPWASSLEIAPDGSVWAEGWASTDAPAVAVFDGAAWTVHSKASTGLPRGPSLAGVAPDGTVWVELPAEGCRLTDTDAVSCTTPAAGVARFDGTRWTVYTTAEGLAADDANVFVGADGSVWATYGPAPGMVSRFDGTRWVTVAVPELAEAQALAAAPDGSLWLGSPDGLLRYDGTAVTRHALPDLEVPVGELPALELSPSSGPTITPSAFGTISWRVYEATSYSWWALAGTPYGPVTLDGTGLHWLTSTGTWEGTTLPFEGWRVTAAGDDVIVHGQGAVRLSWDGSRWVVGDTLEMPQSSDGIQQVVFGPRGAVTTRGTTVLWSADGLSFEPAERGPDKASLVASGSDSRGAACGSAVGLSGAWLGTKIGPVLATDDGFVAFTPALPTSWDKEPLCEPVPWFSADSQTWSLATAESPFGAGASLQGIATWNGRHVAVGGVSGANAVWVSEDGLTWQRLEPDAAASDFGPSPGDYLVTVSAAESGWMIVRSDGAAWTSRDGRTWEPLRGWPGIRLVGYTWGDQPQSVAFGGGTVAASGSLPGDWQDGVVVVGTIEP